MLMNAIISFFRNYSVIKIFNSKSAEWVRL